MTMISAQLAHELLWADEEELIHVLIDYVSLDDCDPCFAIEFSDQADLDELISRIATRSSKELRLLIRDVGQVDEDTGSLGSVMYFPDTQWNDEYDD